MQFTSDLNRDNIGVEQEVEFVVRSPVRVLLGSRGSRGGERSHRSTQVENLVASTI